MARPELTDQGEGDCLPPKGTVRGQPQGVIDKASAGTNSLLSGSNSATQQLCGLGQMASPL